MSVSGLIFNEKPNVKSCKWISIVVSELQGDFQKTTFFEKCLYRVSIFGHFCRVSRLFVTIEDCGFRDTVLLFYETKDDTNKIFIALLVSEIQGEIKKWHFWYTLRISVVS